MLSTAIPTKFGVPFANSAAVGYITPVPETTADPTRASLTLGFPPNTFQQLAAGGNPPFGADFNGLLNQITAWLRWVQAGGAPVGYDSAFQTKIAGYPKGAFLQSATQDRFWISSTENNATNPDAGGAGWIAFPDVIVQKQAGNFAIDTGTVNNYTIALTPTPATLAAIIGSPIRVQALFANTINNPLIHINAAAGSTTATMINSDGSPLLIGQIARPGQIFEGFLDNFGFFQVTTPAPIVGGVPGSSAITGVIYEWPAETPPTWGLECNGAQYLISSYPNLFNIIGNRFGGDGVDYFKVPDKRGAFTRGWDHGRGLDPGAATRTDSGNGTTGDHVGTWQDEALNVSDLNDLVLQIKGEFNDTPRPDTYHGLVVNLQPGLATPFAGGELQAAVQGGDSVVTVPGAASTNLDTIYDINGRINITGGGIETRPVNIDMMYVIAF